MLSSLLKSLPDMSTVSRGTDTAYFGGLGRGEQERVTRSNTGLEMERPMVRR
jgi:hypothetical protein